MKIQANILLILPLISTLSLDLCKPCIEPEIPEIYVRPEFIYAPASGTTATFYVRTNLEWWHIESVPSRITVSPTSGKNGDSIIVCISENPLSVERNYGFFVTVENERGSEHGFISIFQEASEGGLSPVSPVELSTDLSVVTLGAEAYSQQDLTINTNTNWYLRNIPRWLYVSKGSGGGTSTITLIATTANDSSSERSDTLKVCADDKHVDVVVKQRGENL